MGGRPVPVFGYRLHGSNQRIESQTATNYAGLGTPRRLARRHFDQGRVGGWPTE